jgi:hypothetical protein
LGQILGGTNSCLQEHPKEQSSEHQHPAALSGLRRDGAVSLSVD